MTAPRNIRQHTSARLLVAASLALVALLAPAPAAQAKKLKIGVHSQNSLNASEIQRMGEGNVGALRMIFRWSQVEPDPEQPPNWALLDFVMRPGRPVRRRRSSGDPRHAQLGLRQPGRLLAGGGPGLAHQRIRGDPAAAVHRGGCGPLRARRHVLDLQPEHPPRPITEYQLWNEPNRPLFSPGGTPAPAAYATFLQTTYSTIKSLDPKAQVLLTPACPSGPPRASRSTST